MKRTRAELAADPKDLSEAPAKTQRRPKDSAAHRAGSREAAASLEKPRETLGEEERQANYPAESSEAAAAVMEEDEGVVRWDGAAELGGVAGCWWWGVEEEKLLGWFPFADEDFLCCEERGWGEIGGLLWEEEDHDIWQLQHINEIPSAAKQ